jgi:hypothetical protein
VVSFVALFVALGGVGWAAVNLPANSVGTKQLKKGAVTIQKIQNDAVNYSKILPHTVGIGRINPDQVQARVSGTCSGAHGAMGAIDGDGGVTCDQTVPTSLNESSASVPVGTTSTTVGTKALGAGFSYLVIANPYATITSTTAGQRVVVTCTLAANGVSQSRAASVEVGASKHTLQTAIPIVLPAPSQSTAGTTTLSCSKASTPSSPSPTVNVQTTISAVTAQNG